MMHDWWSWNGSGWGGMWFGPLFMFLFLVAVVAAIVALVRWMSGTSDRTETSSHSPSARSILDQRFARGEIDADEYEARRRVLEK